MPKLRRDNLLIVQCHDIGRFLGAYGHPGLRSPRLDAMATDGILLTRAHATAPLCSPALGSMYTGRYPHSHGLLRLVHQGWEYRSGVRTLPKILSDAGWYSALFGMQHETTRPTRLGFHEYDVSNAYCDYVVGQAAEWLRNRAADVQPFLLTAGFFEAHRPYPRERYTPADVNEVKLPDCWPDTDEVRRDFAEFYGAISAADAAVGQLLDVLAATGLDANTWVVFATDHGPAFPRAMSTLYDAGTGIALIVRPPRAAGVTPGVYDELFSGVDLLPTLLGLLGLDEPAGVDGISHAQNLLASPRETTAVRNEIFSAKAHHDSCDHARAVRTKDYSYIETYHHRPAASTTLDIQTGSPVKVIVPEVVAPQPERELYDLLSDPHETRNMLAEPTDEAAALADRLAATLAGWRQNTGDFVGWEHADAQLAEHYAGLYWQMHTAGGGVGRTKVLRSRRTAQPHRPAPQHY
ncbi:MAG TPA: sulfatase-like hydrolase/transferase [Mycobacterium sp.]|nr:sulfatase-like hydrolase/transferase [Mycobacterium sp.]